MRFEDNFGDLPRFLHPRMRVFLSVDVIGSTRIKQRSPTRKSGPDPYEADRPPHNVWLKELAGFYGAFTGIFASEWSKRKTQAEQLDLSIVGHPPQLWKTNGDEVIYVKDVKHRDEIVLFVASWIAAISRYRTEFNGTLDIKSTGWCAGFPLLNSEIILDQTPERRHTQFRDDWILNNLYLLDKWYNKEIREDVIRDYIGPSIDTGFRLCSFSTSRRFIVSVELAWFLSGIIPPQSDEASSLLKLPPLHFSGEAHLRGVFGGHGYPLFWIDISPNTELSRAYDNLREYGSDPDNIGKIQHYCRLFFQQNQLQFPTPFIAREEGMYNNSANLNYVKNITRLSEIYKEETERYQWDGKGEVRPEPQNEDDDDTVSIDINGLIERLPKPGDK